MEFKPVEVDPEVLSDYERKEYYAHIQAWYSENFPKETMIYKDAAHTSIQFLRDEPRHIFGDKLKSIEVISTHTSKSIKLPVVLITFKNGMQFIIRDNFYDYKLTIISPKGLDLPTSLFNRIEENVHHVFCEGFKDEWVLPKYESKNNKRFTVEIYSEYLLYTTLFLINEQI